MHQFLRQALTAGFAQLLFVSTSVGDTTLSGYWKFDGGATTDASVYGNDGQALNLGIITGFDGSANGAFVWSDQAAQFLVPDAASLRTPNALSVSMWVKSPAIPDRVFISKYNSSAGRNDWTFATYNLEGDELNPRVFASGDITEFGMQRRTTNTDIPVNTWTHIGFSFSSSGPILRIFENGLEQPGVTFGDVVPSIHVSNEPLRIGAFVNRFGELNSFSGVIDEVRVYNAALSHTQFAALGRAASTLEWVADQDASWDSIGNWNYRIPDDVGEEVTFSDTITGARRVSLESSRTIGTATFSSSSGYTLDGTGTLVLEGAAGSSLLSVVNGSHTISNALDLRTSTTVATLNALARLTITGEMTAAAGRTLTKTGAGKLEVKHLRVDGVSIDGERIVIRPGALSNEPARVSRVKSLTLAGGTTPVVVFDLNNNSIVVDFDGASVRSTLEAQIAAGRRTGVGIISGSPDALSGIAALGIAEATETGIGNLFGQPTDSTTAIIRYTRIGDANLSGTTDISDFALLAANFNVPGRWFTGDFNLNGTTEIGDFALLAANFNQSLPANSPQPIPEPVLTALLTFFAAPELRRHCKTRRSESA